MTNSDTDVTKAKRDAGLGFEAGIHRIKTEPDGNLERRIHTSDAKDSDRITKIDPVVLESIWHMIPHDAKVESEALSTSRFSSEMMSEAGLLIESVLDHTIARHVPHAGEKLVYFLTGLERFKPKEIMDEEIAVPYEYRDGNGRIKRRFRKKEYTGFVGDHREDTVTHPPRHPLLRRFARSVKDREYVYERYMPCSISYTQKEKEVAEFLRLFESRMVLATSREEVSLEIEEMLRVTHLPLEVAIYFYEKTKHRNYYEDIFLDVMRLEHEIARDLEKKDAKKKNAENKEEAEPKVGSNETVDEETIDDKSIPAIPAIPEKIIHHVDAAFCYDAAFDLYHETLKDMRERHHREESWSDLLPQNVKNGILLEGAAEAMERYKAKMRKLEDLIREGQRWKEQKSDAPCLILPEPYKSQRKENGYDRTTKHFEELERGVNFLCMYSPVQRGDTLHVKMQRLMVEYKDAYWSIAYSPLVKTQYAVPYVYLCYETFDNDALLKFLRFCIGHFTGTFFDDNEAIMRSYEMSTKGRARKLFEDESWGEGDLDLAKTTLMAWNALKKAIERGVDNGGKEYKKGYSDIEKDIERLRKIVGDDLIRGYIMKRIESSFTPIAVLENFNCMFTLRPLLAVLGDPQLDYEVSEEIARHAKKAMLTAHMYADGIFDSYFDLPNEPFKQVNATNNPHSVLFRLSSPKNNLPKAELMRWQDKFTALFRPLHEYDVNQKERGLTRAKERVDESERREYNISIRFNLGDGNLKEALEEGKPRITEVYDLGRIDPESMLAMTIDSIAQEILSENRSEKIYEKRSDKISGEKQKISSRKLPRFRYYDFSRPSIVALDLQNRLDLQTARASDSQNSLERRKKLFVVDHGRQGIDHKLTQVGPYKMIKDRRTNLFCPLHMFSDNGFNGLVACVQEYKEEDEFTYNYYAKGEAPAREALFRKTDEGVGIWIFDEDNIAKTSSGIYVFKIKDHIYERSFESFAGDFVAYKENQERYAKACLERYDLMSALGHMAAIDAKINYVEVARGWLNELREEVHRPLTTRDRINIIRSCAAIMTLGEGRWAPEVGEYNEKMQWSNDESDAIMRSIFALKYDFHSTLNEYVIDSTRKHVLIEEELFDEIMRTASRFYEECILENGGTYLLSIGRRLFEWLKNYWPNFKNTMMTDIEGKYCYVHGEHLRAQLFKEADEFIAQHRYSEAHTIYTRLDLEDGSRAFFKRVYEKSLKDVSKEGDETNFRFRNPNGSITDILLRNEQLVGYGSFGVGKTSIVVNCNGRSGKGRRVLVTKVNDDERVTALEHRLYKEYKARYPLIIVAEPLVINEKQIVVEHCGQNLVEFAKNANFEGNSELANAYISYLSDALRQKSDINRSLGDILSDEEKQFLEERRLGKVLDVFGSMHSREEIEKSYHAFRVMRAFGFHDPAFGEAYMRTIGRALNAIPQKYRTWIKDNYAANFAVIEDDTTMQKRVAVFDFNNIYYDAMQLDDSIFLHTYGLKLSKEGEEAFINFCIELAELPKEEYNDVMNPNCGYKRGFIPASVHRNLLMAGNIMRAIEAGRAPKEKYVEVEHHMGIAMRYITEFSRVFGDDSRVFGEEFAAGYDSDRPKGKEGFKNDLIHVITKARLWCELHFGCLNGELDQKALFADMQAQRIVQTEKYNNMGFSE